MDISGILRNTGVALEAQAYQTFGAAVNNQAQGILSGVFNSGSIGGINNANGGDNRIVDFDQVTTDYNGIWSTVNYAQALASGVGGFDPKNGFLFKVSFEFDTEVAKIANQLGPNVLNVLNRNLSFLVKSIEMPKFKFDYTEFNYYNFRTKMLRRVQHEPLSFKMYDDVANNALSFINTYLQLLAPIHRQEYTAGSDLENNGFAFSRDLSQFDTSQRGVLGELGSQKNVLRSMKIEQYYLDRSDGTLAKTAIRRAIRANVFTFTNPRLDSFELPDHDYDATSEPQQISCTFDYDALHIKTGLYVDEMEQDGDGFMEMNDILGDRDGSLVIGPNQRGPVSLGGGGGGAMSPFLGIIANQGGRLVQTAVTNALYRNGMGGIAGGALANAISTIGGTLGTNASRTLALAGRGVSVGIVAPNRPPIADNAIGGNFLGRTVSSFIGGGG
jgi:hypothetical protein